MHLLSFLLHLYLVIPLLGYSAPDEALQWDFATVGAFCLLIARETLSEARVTDENCRAADAHVDVILRDQFEAVRALTFDPLIQVAYAFNDCRF